MMVNSIYFETSNLNGTVVKIFKEYLDIKPYWVDNGFYYLTRRNIYHIPAMEEQCITISNKFAFNRTGCSGKRLLYPITSIIPIW